MAADDDLEDGELPPEAQTSSPHPKRSDAAAHGKRKTPGHQPAAEAASEQPAAGGDDGASAAEQSKKAAKRQRALQALMNAAAPEVRQAINHQHQQQPAQPPLQRLPQAPQQGQLCKKKKKKKRNRQANDPANHEQNPPAATTAPTVPAATSAIPEADSEAERSPPAAPPAPTNTLGQTIQQAVYNSAHPSVELKTNTAIPTVGIEHVRDLALYALLGPSLIQAPFFAFVKNQPLLERVLLVVTPGLTEHMFNTHKADMPEFSALGQPLVVKPPRDLATPSDIAGLLMRLPDPNQTRKRPARTNTYTLTSPPANHSQQHPAANTNTASQQPQQPGSKTQSPASGRASGSGLAITGGSFSMLQQLDEGLDGDLDIHVTGSSAGGQSGRDSKGRDKGQGVGRQQAQQGQQAAAQAVASPSPSQQPVQPVRGPFPASHYIATIKQLQDNNYPLPDIDSNTGRMLCPPGWVVTQRSPHSHTHSPASPTALHPGMHTVQSSPAVLVAANQATHNGTAGHHNHHNHQHTAADTNRQQSNRNDSASDSSDSDSQTKSKQPHAVNGHHAHSDGTSDGEGAGPSSKKRRRRSLRDDVSAAAAGRAPHTSQASGALGNGAAAAGLVASPQQGVCATTAPVGATTPTVGGTSASGGAAGAECLRVWGGDHVMALDCEMCLTEAGFELTRLTLLDGLGAVVTDTLVRPDRQIKDYLERYSGMNAAMLEGVTTRLADAQALLLRHMTADTLLVGHGLENDLRALKLLHGRILDTALLYPHPSGPPAKCALRVLCSKYLRRTIQQGSHDSAVDARAALDLVRLKVQHGPNWGLDTGRPQGHAALKPVAELLREQNKRLAVVATHNAAIARFCSHSASVVAITSDQEAAKKAAQLAKSHALTACHLREVEVWLQRRANQYREWDTSWRQHTFTRSETQTQQGQGANNKPAGIPPPVDAILRGQWQPPSGPCSVSEGLTPALKSLSAHVGSLWRSVPANTLVVVVSGTGDIEEWKRLQEQMFKRKGRAQGAAQNVLYSSWTPAADEAYQEWTARQRRTLVWAAVKQPATASDAPAGS